MDPEKFDLIVYFVEIGRERSTIVQKLWIRRTINRNTAAMQLQIGHRLNASKDIGDIEECNVKFCFFVGSIA
uniref:HTH_48 domain-containing protein n=1 Tax=Steinernema glaseri TaxID=37863 RepID=A0A1I7YHD5_9BILA